MKNIEVKIVADSVNPIGKRITSFLLTYPRFIHSELMTHRMLSRNAASSRAIPIAKQLDAVQANPAHPERWGTNGKGMQDHGLHTYPNTCFVEWEAAANIATLTAKSLQGLGLHKQIVNRVVEPFSHITVLVTATEWDNFFALRAHPDAQPEFQVLAYRMLDAYLTNEPKGLEWGDWHLPFTPDGCFMQDHHEPSHEKLALTKSVASAARTSYTTHDKEFTFEQQKALVDKLSSGGHWSPFEHQAQAEKHVNRSGNFKGCWQQLRVTYPKQNRDKVDLAAIMSNKPAWITL